MKHQTKFTVPVLALFPTFISGCVTTKAVTEEKVAIAKPISAKITNTSVAECTFDQLMLNMGEIVGDGIVLGTYGAMEGAIHGAIAGSASDGVVIGAAVFGTIGLGIGAYEAVKEYKPKSCGTG